VHGRGRSEWFEIKNWRVNKQKASDDTVHTSSKAEQVRTRKTTGKDTEQARKKTRST